MKWKQDNYDWYEFTTAGQNNKSKIDYLFHKLGGMFLWPGLSDNLFEVWGEYYVKWKLDDFQAAYGYPWNRGY